MSADANAVTVAAPAVTPPSKTHWDRVAETTRWGRYLTEVEKRVILLGAELSPEPGRGLDLGCGSGRWSKLLSDRGWKMTCADVNSHALSLCRRNVPSASTMMMHADARSLPMATACAQLALCIEVVPLVESDWLVPELRRVLTRGGLFIGVYINGRSLRGMAWRLKHRLFNRTDDEKFYRNAYPAWRESLMAEGFEMLHEESCCWGPFSRDSNSPFVPACARVERALGLHRIVNWSPWIVFIARKK